MHRVPGKHWWSTLAGGALGTAIGFAVVVVSGLSWSSFSGEPQKPVRLGRAASVGRWPDSGQRLPCTAPDDPYVGVTVRRILTRRGLVVRRYIRTGRTPLFVAVANLAQVKAGPLLRGGVSRLTTLRTKIAGSGAMLAVNGEFFHLGQDGSPNGVEVAAGGSVDEGTSTPQPSLVVQRNHTATIASVWLSVPISTAAGIVDAQSYNSDYLPANGIAVFTPSWGTKTRRYLRPHQPVREFVLSNNTVHAVNRRITKTAIPRNGAIIEAQGSAADRLVKSGLRPGAPYGVSSAIGVGLQLVRHSRYEGPVCSVDRPVARTIVGILPGGSRLFLAVAQGQTDSAHGNFSGLTVQQSTALAYHLVAVDAVMLDGGGSAGMVVVDPNDSVTQYTHSADGWNQYIPNGFGIWPQ